MNVTVAVAIVAALASLGSAVIAAKTADRGRKTETTATESAQALDAWKEFVQPLREENARLRDENRELHDQLEHERRENDAVMSGLIEKAENQAREIKRLRRRTGVDE